VLLKKFFAVTTVALASIGCASTHAELMTGNPIPVVGNVGDPAKIVELEVETKKWKCPNCNTNEQYVLEQLQQKTNISDRNALASIMGNIKAESGFIPNICEGGARVPYHKCLRGGYGLIQWTTATRYNNLGRFCKKYGCDPSSLKGQTRFMINEVQFQKLLPEFEGHGFTVAQYMVPSYYWLGWGIKGRREHYAYDYTKKLIFA